MGTACHNLSFLCTLKTGDWIALLGVIINSALAYWIVRTIQYKLTNKRVLKDHFINEIKDIRNDYKTFLNNLYSNSTQPQRVIPWFKLMNIKINDLMTHINTKYKIDKNKLKPYQIELPDLITNNEDFITQFNSDKVTLTESSRTQLIKFQQLHNQLFNEIIIEINDAE